MPQISIQRQAHVLLNNHLILQIHLALLLHESVLPIPHILHEQNTQIHRGDTSYTFRRLSPGVFHLDRHRRTLIVLQVPYQHLNVILVLSLINK